MEKGTPIKNIILKALFVIGIVVIVIMLAFALFRLLPKVFSSFAQVGNVITSPFKDEIVIKTNNPDLNNQELFSLNWEYKPTEVGEFYFKYDCVENASIDVISDNGETALLCNKAYNLNDARSANFRAILNKENLYVDVPLNILYGSENANKIIATGDFTISIKNQGKATENNLIGARVTNSDIINVEDVETVEERQTTPSQNVTISRADLAISNIISNNNQISFTVSNIGGQASGIWYFSYLISGENIVYSSAQMSLRRGEGIRYTLTFDNENNGTVVVVVDPTGIINESNKNNNSFSINFNGTGNNSDDNSYNSNDDANLEIKQLEVGKMSGDSFREDDEIDEDDDAAVRFIVKNTGGENSGSWRYEITNLPYDNDDDYESNSQPSLRPGESREIILSFENIDEGNYNIKVEVDSRDDVDEEDERDNDESERLEVTN